MALADNLSNLIQPDNFAIKSSSQVLEVSVEGLPADYLSFLQECWNSYSQGLLRFLLPAQNPPLGIWEQNGGWGEDWGTWRKEFFVFAYD